MDNFPTSVPGQRVTDVIQTDVTQHLALPVTYAPDQEGNNYAQLASKDMPLSNDRAVVHQAVRLLNSTDLSYLKLRSVPSFLGSRGGPLRYQVERMAPHLFQSSGVDDAAEMASAAVAAAVAMEQSTPQRPEAPPEAPPEPQEAAAGPSTAADVVPVAVRTPGQKRKLKGAVAAFQPPAVFGSVEEEAMRQAAAPSAPEPTPAPAPAPVPEKKKKPQRTEQTWTTTQAEAVEDVNVADHFSKVVSRMIEKAKSIEESMQQDGGDGEDGDGEADDRETLHRRCLPLEDLKALNVEAMRVADSGMLKEVVLDDLVEIISLMHTHVKAGCGSVLEDDDGSSSDSFQRILLSAEASLTILHLMTADGLAAEVFNEDAIESVMEFVNYHLKYNIYVFYDMVQRRKFRPSTYNDTDEQRAAKKAKLGSKRAGLVVSAAAKTLTARMEVILGVLQQLFSRVMIQGSQVNTLVNAVLQVLTIEGLELLQLNAIQVLVSVFQEYPEQRKGLVEAFIGGVLFNTPTGRSARKYMIPSEDDMHILPVSALMMQLVQVASRLPAQDSNHPSKMNAFAASVTWSDALWVSIFDRLPHARAQKSETEYDMRSLVEMIMADMLTVLHLPDWPGATTLLLRFVTILGGQKGLQYNDAAVRQACVDLLGQISSRLSAEIKAADEDTEWVEGIVGKSDGRPYVGLMGKLAPDPSTLEADEKADALCARGQWLLLDHLLRGPQAYFPAAMFNMCRMFSEEMRELVRGDGDEGGQGLSDALVEQQGAEILAKYRQIAGGQPEEAPCRFPEGVVLGRPAACHLSRYLFKRSALGKGGPAMLKWIIDMLDRGKQVPGTRAKAVKALGMVVEADTRLLGRPEVKIGVNRSLHDDAISVREAAVDLLGRHIGTDVDLAMAFFDLIGQAATDTGTSVRKRAVKILWESCIRIPNFPRATEACIRVLQRVTDPEESIHSLVGRIFHDLWFSPSGGTVGIGSPAARAQQLADVAISVYEGTGANIHLPLGSSHPLVAVVAQAVHNDQASGPQEAKGPELKEGAAIASALLEEVLKTEEGHAAAATEENGADEQQPEEPPPSPFPFLLALHAFSTADPTLVVPQRDKARFLRELLPYLKVTDAPAVNPDSSEEAAKASRRSAEQVIAILHIFDSIMRHLDSVPRALVDELLLDLTALIQKHKFVQVVAAACRCLGSLADVDSKASTHAIKVSLAVYAKLKGQLSHAPSEAPQLSKWAAGVGRLLYMLGQLCRHAASVLDPGKSAPLAMEHALSLALGFFNVKTKHSGEWLLQLQENALQCAGQVFIAKPTLMVRKEADGMVSKVLGQDAPAKLKMRALSNLSDLLKSEEERLLVAQKAGESAQRETKALKSAGLRAAGTSALQVTNGEGDSVSLASGIIQRYWERVLFLSTDVPPRGGGSPSQDELYVPIRQQAMELMEAVLRSGLVAPWTAVPRLVALATDPGAAISSRARRILRQESDKHAAFFDGRVAEGMEVAFRFHKSLSLAAGRSIGDRTAEVMKGISQLYTVIIQPQRNMKINFLSTLLKKFDVAVELDETAPPCDLNLLRFLADVSAALPYKKADEPLSIIHSINALVSRRAEFVRTALKTQLQNAKGSIVQTAVEPPPEGGAAPEGEGEAALPAVQIAPEKELEACEGMAMEIRATYAVSILLQLKQHLRVAYRLDTDRIANFSPYGEKRKNEERMPCSKAKGSDLNLAAVPLGAFASLQVAAEVYNSFKSLMADDSADYGDGVLMNFSKKARRQMDEMNAPPGTTVKKKPRGRPRKSAPN